MLAVSLAALLTLSTGLEESATFQDGVTQYRELELEAAIERFRAAADEPGMTDADRAVALIWEAMADTGLGDDAAARDAVRRALELDVDVTVPDIAPPKLRGFLDEIRPEVLAAKPAIEEPPPPPTTTTSEPVELPWLLIGGGATAAVGVVGLVGAGVVTVLMIDSLNRANDRTQFQSEAKAALDAANVEAGIAAGLAAGSVLVVAAGAGLIGYDLFASE